MKKLLVVLAILFLIVSVNAAPIINPSVQEESSICKHWYSKWICDIAPKGDPGAAGAPGASGEGNITNYYNASLNLTSYSNETWFYNASIGNLSSFSNISNFFNPSNFTSISNISNYYNTSLTGSSDHHLLSNLTTGDDHTQYALLAGRAGGQTLNGGLNSSDNLILNANGENVGIGITNPLVKLDILSTSDTGGAQLRLSNNATGGDDWFLASTDNNWTAGGGKFLITSNGGSSGAKLVINSSGVVEIAGNVGIGITNPSKKLDVLGDIKLGGLSDGYGRLFLNQKVTRDKPTVILVGADDITSGTNELNFGGGTSSGYIVQSIRFHTVANDNTSGSRVKMIINSSGNVGIGTTSPSTQLHTTGAVRFANFGAGAATFDANGVISSVSDEKTKTNINSFSKGLTELLQINPIVYKYSENSGLDTKNNYVGFSAQNLQKAVPEIVYSKPDIKYEIIQEKRKSGEDESKTIEVPLGTNTLSIYDRGLMALMVNAIKEQQLEIDNQQKQIDELKIRLDKLEGVKQ